MGAERGGAVAGDDDGWLWLVLGSGWPAAGTAHQFAVAFGDGDYLLAVVGVVVVVSLPAAVVVIRFGWLLVVEEEVEVVGEVAGVEREGVVVAGGD